MKPLRHVPLAAMLVFSFLAAARGGESIDFDARLPGTSPPGWFFLGGIKALGDDTFNVSNVECASPPNSLLLEAPEGSPASWIVGHDLRDPARVPYSFSFAFMLRGEGSHQFRYAVELWSKGNRVMAVNFMDKKVTLHDGNYNSFQAEPYEIGKWYRMTFDFPGKGGTVAMRREARSPGGAFLLEKEVPLVRISADVVVTRISLVKNAEVSAKLYLDDFRDQPIHAK